MKKTIKDFVFGLFSCLISTYSVVAQRTYNSVYPRLSGSFTSTGAGYQEPYFGIEGFIPFQNATNGNLTFARRAPIIIHRRNNGRQLITWTSL